MKTIVNKLRLALLLGFMALGITVLAQAIPNQEKMTISTQMFLDELAGRISFDEPKPTIRAGQPDLIPLPEARNKRPIAKPDTINGKVYITSFIQVTGDDFIADLEALGVDILANLGDGVLTTYIPIDMIEEVAAIEGVILVEVGELMQEETDLARQASNVDDLLTLSQDAQLAGLQQMYDGKDVILAIMDSGIDFQHIAFKDKNGNSRIKGAYCYNGSSVTANWTGSGSLPTTDSSDSDHGTHTSSIAGGSSVIVNGTNITVTDDHANATYGGMAPGADLYLGGFSGLNNVHMATAYQQAIDYADAQGKPLVVSNSWSTTTGPRDGQLGSSMQTFIHNNFGDSHPNRVCLFAASNRAGNAIASEGGGIFVSGISSRNNPVGSILRYRRYSNADGGYCYNGYVLDAWGRSTTQLGITIYVLDNNTGEVLKSVSYTPTGTTTVSGLSDYYSGSLTIYVGTNSVSGKRQIRLNANAFETTGESYDSANNFYHSNYTLAVEVYPTSGSCIVDMWGGTIAYFNNSLTTNGHNWLQGSDDCSASDNSMWPEVISVGSYITREGGSSGNEVGDISPFSGYAIASVSPGGVDIPWISAPGQLIVSAFNHLNTERSSTPLVNNTNNPYGTAQGTSMATPAAAGIVTLWMQAAAQCGHQLTHSEIKNIMAETAIRDSWVTSGPNASHFGNGKIDALAGIEYILSQYAVPTIIATPNPVTFDTEPNQSKSQTVAVSSRMLTGDITATLNDNTGYYSINTTNLGNGGNLIITYSPLVTGSHNATVTLTSPGANPVTVTINGTAALKSDTTICDGTTSNETLPVYGWNYETAQTNQMLYPSGKFTNSGMNGKKIKKIKFYPTSYGNYSGINFYYQASRGNGTVTVKLANMPSGTTGYTNRNPTRKNADFVTVKTITMPAAAQTGLTEWVFDNLDNEFTYTGGDLLIEVVTEAGMYGHTYFAGESQSSYTGYYSYGSTARGQQFLPKVTFEWEAEVVPVTAGTVSPSELTFTDVPIGKNSVQTVTVTNTGNQNFTPVIDTTNLPNVFTVTGTGEVLPNGSIDLTVTYSPTDEGPHSGSFTVTIGDQTYTVTVTGNGITINSTLVSNVVTVDVYHSELQADLGTYIFTEDEVVLDEDMSLAYNEEDGDVTILVKRDEPITQYDVWTYPDGYTVATAMRNGNGYTTDNGTFNFIDDATQMWMPLDINSDGSDVISYYVPVTIADGVVTTGNTYGAPAIAREYDPVTLNLDIGGSKSDKRLGGHWTQTLPDGTQKEYCVYTPIIFIEAPQLDNITHKPYMLRAWLVADDEVTYYNFDRIDGAIKGTTVLDMPYLLGELPVVEGMPGVNFIIGEEWDAETSPIRLQNAFGAPCEKANVVIVVRAYYQRIQQGNSNMLRDGGGGYGFGQGSGSGDHIPTAVNEVFDNRQLVDVTYINTLGMQSSKPFDGVNIVVTRYSDGSFSTTKVVR